MKQLSLLLCILLLTSCVSREQADSRLELGCKAAAELFLEEGFVIKEVKKATFKDSPEFGTSYRQVSLQAIESDEWLDVEKDYKCVFAEEFKAFGGSHRADLYQLQVNGETYGFKAGNILGDMKTQMNISEAVQRAMSQ